MRANNFGMIMNNTQYIFNSQFQCEQLLIDRNAKQIALNWLNDHGMIFPHDYIWFCDGNDARTITINLLNNRVKQMLEGKYGKAVQNDRSVNKYGMITVSHIKKLCTHSWEWVDVTVDRSSVLGNPFPLSNESDRIQVVEQYWVWLMANVELARSGYKEDSVTVDASLVSNKFKYPNSGLVVHNLLNIYNRVKAGTNVRLLCWCYPKLCHANSIELAIKLKLAGKLESAINLSYQEACQV